MAQIDLVSDWGAHWLDRFSLRQEYVAQIDLVWDWSWEANGLDQFSLRLRSMWLRSILSETEEHIAQIELAQEWGAGGLN